MVTCICGGTDYKKIDRQHYEITSEGDTIKALGNGVSFGKCSKCGIIRQITSPFENEKEYSEYYRKKYQPNHGAYKKKTYEHDKDVATMRFNEYKIKKETLLLDVGAGSGAFVDVCRINDIYAYGCELSLYNYAPENNFVYYNRLEDINFPTDYFDTVTCHDVLEHTINPVGFIKEMFRITAQDGRCIIDIPNYFCTEGEHHWKEEHIWFFTSYQLTELVKKIGFRIDKVSTPIPSKVVMYLTKTPQTRHKILLPPGIGDSYWSIIKMQSFIKREGIDIPEVCIASPREKIFDGHRRAFPFLRLFPFVYSGGEVLDSGQNMKLREIWLEAYQQQGRTIFKDIAGYDYFISYNGHLRVGKQMEELDKDLECNWFPPMFTSLEQENYRIECKQKFGDYIVFYFVFQGTYKYWTDQFPIKKVIRSVNRIAEETGCTPVFAGAIWDRERDDLLKEVKQGIHNYIDMTGQTNVEQLFGMLRGSKMVIGYPSGLSIMSAVLKVKTLIIWNDFYNREFAWYCVPPEVRNNTYHIEFTNDLTPDKLVNRVKEII